MISNQCYQKASAKRMLFWELKLKNCNFRHTGIDSLDLITTTTIPLVSAEIDGSISLQAKFRPQTTF